MLNKIIAALGAAVGFLLVVLKLKNDKIERIEDENEILDVKDKISDDMNLAIEAAKKDEVKRNEKRNNDIDPFDSI